MSPSGPEGANISGFARPLGKGIVANSAVESDSVDSVDGLVENIETVRVRKNFPESWIWSANFSAE